jgi:hypothetical protein
MKAISKIVAGGIGLAALAGAAPAAAQYYPAPNYPYPAPSPYGYGQGGLGAIIDQLLGGNRYAYGADQRFLVERCVAAVTNRIDRTYASNRYGYPYGQGGYGAYGYGYGAGRAQVLAITNIDRDRRELQVRGIATANAYGGGYGGAYGSPYGYGQPAGELRFRCDIDYRGRVRDIDLNRNRADYRYGYPYRR